MEQLVATSARNETLSAALSAAREEASAAREDASALKTLNEAGAAERAREGEEARGEKKRIKGELEGAREEASAARLNPQPHTNHHPHTINPKLPSFPHLKPQTTLNPTP